MLPQDSLVTATLPILICERKILRVRIRGYLKIGTEEHMEILNPFRKNILQSEEIVFLMKCS